MLRIRSSLAWLLAPLAVAVAVAAAATILTETADTQLESDQESARFGEYLAVGDVDGNGYGDVLVVAPFFDSGQSDEGAAFLFLGRPGGIPSGGRNVAAKRIATDQSQALLTSVAFADVNGDGYDDVVAGSPSYNPGGTSGGAVFIFLGSAAGLVGQNPATAATVLLGDQNNARFGSGVANAGDVNGDGYEDVLVGAYRYNAGTLNEGVAFLFEGSAAGIANGGPASADTWLESNQGSSRLGISVAGAGDVNGDGYDDVIVGADSYDGTIVDGGAAFVFLGSAAGVADGHPGTAATRIQGDQADTLLGGEVAGAGDVDGDGFDDVIVGAHLYGNAPAGNEGAAFIFRGSATGIADGGPAEADTRLEGDQNGASLGWSVAAAGDVDGDGYDDVVVGALGFGDPDDIGAALLFLGSAAGIPDAIPATAAALLLGPHAGARMGSAVAGNVDVDGDGFDDLVVGAYQYDGGENNEGAAFVYHGGPLPPDCSDGLDNDGDGLVDHPADPDCTDPLDESEGGPPPACSDGIDNDGDGFTDHPADPQCTDPLDESEGGPPPACNDGIDNDGDGFTDFPDDPQCTIKEWNSERPRSCGLGGETVLLIAPLLAAAARRRRARSH